MNHEIIFEQKIIHYREEGQGPVVVFLHGFMESLEMWNDFFEQMSSGFRIVAVDLPGHGRSEVYSDIHQMWFMADCVNAVLEQLQIDECMMVGHSMGGYVSMAFSKKYPSKVKALVLFHSSAAADNEDARENRRRAIAIVLKNHSGYINQFIPELFAPENREKFAAEIGILQNRARSTSAKSIVAAQKGMMERESMLDLLISVTYPVLFILGSQDSRIPLQKVLAQAILPVHSETLILGNVGHMGFIEAKDETVNAIRYFAIRHMINKKAAV